MKTIYKYALQVTDSQVVSLPKGAEILTVQTQHEYPHLWAMVDPAAPKTPRHFEIFGTGHAVHEGMGIDRKYIGTFQMQGGALVFHLFERF